MRHISVLGLLATLALGLAAAAAAQAAKTPTLVVQQFSAKPGVDWPYDFALLQKETIAKLQDKLKQKAEVVATAPAAGAVYSLQGEVVRMYQRNDLDNHSGGISSNNDVITVHYWLADASGKKLFDKTSTYSSPSTGSYSDAVFGTSGPMAKDLESDLAGRVAGAKIYGAQ
ncbi:MAG: hypothetical protein ACRD1L_08430 [Terriglobales bacterium]